MAYSFAMALSIIWARPAFALLLVPGFDARWITDNMTWVTWVVNLGIAHWWLNRGR